MEDVEFVYDMTYSAYNCIHLVDKKEENIRWEKTIKEREEKDKEIRWKRKKTTERKNQRKEEERLRRESVERRQIPDKEWKNIHQEFFHHFLEKGIVDPRTLLSGGLQYQEFALLSLRRSNKKRKR
jgi:hypothetical protein